MRHELERVIKEAVLETQVLDLANIAENVHVRVVRQLINNEPKVESRTIMCHENVLVLAHVRARLLLNATVLLILNVLCERIARENSTTHNPIDKLLRTI